MINSATEEEFRSFLTTYGYAVASDVAPLLALSLVFLNTLPWCSDDQGDHDNIKLAQNFIAYGMSAEGGGFNPSARVSGVVVKRQEVDVLEQEFMFNESVNQGSSSLDQLKGFPIAYGLLSQFLCEGVELTADTHRAAVYVV